METWPSIFPKPTLGFSGENDNSLAVSQMESGRKRRRLRFSKELRKYKATFEMSDFQFGMFQSWFMHKIAGGADKFLISLPTGGAGLNEVTAAFADGRYSFTNKGVLHWSVSCVLEVEDAEVWSEATFDTYLITPP